MKITGKLWAALKDEWVKEGREHPILSRVFLFGIPLFVIIRAVLIFLEAKQK